MREEKSPHRTAYPKALIAAGGKPVSRQTLGSLPRLDLNQRSPPYQGGAVTRLGHVASSCAVGLACEVPQATDVIYVHLYLIVTIEFSKSQELHAHVQRAPQACDGEESNLAGRSGLADIIGRTPPREDGSL